MVAAPHKKNHQNDVLNWVQNNSIFLKLIVNLTKINKIHHLRTFHLKNDSDSDTTDSSHESGKNVITWAWPTSTTII
jgi:hypothetical protein